MKQIDKAGIYETCITSAITLVLLVTGACWFYGAGELSTVLVFGHGWYVLRSAASAFMVGIGVGSWLAAVGVVLFRYWLR